MTSMNRQNLVSLGPEFQLSLIGDLAVIVRECIELLGVRGATRGRDRTVGPRPHGPGPRCASAAGTRRNSTWPDRSIAATYSASGSTRPPNTFL